MPSALARKYNRFTRSRRSCGEYHFARGMVWFFEVLKMSVAGNRNSIRDTRGAHQKHITQTAVLFQDMSGAIASERMFSKGDKT